MSSSLIEMVSIEIEDIPMKHIVPEDHPPSKQQNDAKSVSSLQTSEEICTDADNTATSPMTQVQRFRYVSSLSISIILIHIFQR
jgi:hypothetical protein